MTSSANPSLDQDTLCTKILRDVGFYRAQDLARQFSLPALGTWRARRQIFVLTNEHQAAYPAFQFTTDGLDPGVAEVNAALPFDMTATQRLLWWAAPDILGHTRLDSLRPSALAQARELSDHYDLKAVVDSVFAPKAQ